MVKTNKTGPFADDRVRGKWQHTAPVPKGSGKRRAGQANRAGPKGSDLRTVPVSFDDELVLIVPIKLVPGEPGDPFTDEFATLLRSMANCGYWPTDFGETVNTHWITLYFSKSNNSMFAIKSTENFIKIGGEV